MIDALIIVAAYHQWGISGACWTVIGFVFLAIITKVVKD